jgi:hypothetical protein
LLISPPWWYAAWALPLELVEAQRRPRRDDEHLPPVHEAGARERGDRLLDDRVRLVELQCELGERVDRRVVYEQLPERDALELVEGRGRPAGPG